MNDFTDSLMSLMLLSIYSSICSCVAPLEINVLIAFAFFGAKISLKNLSWDALFPTFLNCFLLLASRARDDFGNIQPTIDQETEAVGVESVYHRNAIVTWEITKEGVCNNVQIRKHNKA